jgi:hypothetical protein
LLGGQDRQREVGIQAGPSSGADGEEREEESAGANAKKEKEPLQPSKRSSSSSAVIADRAINGTV